MRLNFVDAPVIACIYCGQAGTDACVATGANVNYFHATCAAQAALKRALNDRFEWIGFGPSQSFELTMIAFKSGALVIATRHPGGVQWKAYPK